MTKDELIDSCKRVEDWAAQAQEAIKKIKEERGMIGENIKGKWKIVATLNNEVLDRRLYYDETALLWNLSLYKPGVCFKVYKNDFLFFKIQRI